MEALKSASKHINITGHRFILLLCIYCKNVRGRLYIHCKLNQQRIWQLCTEFGLSLICSLRCIIAVPHLLCISKVNVLLQYCTMLDSMHACKLTYPFKFTICLHIQYIVKRYLSERCLMYREEIPSAIITSANLNPWE